ncbi:MAG: hypothetical protein ACI9LO_000965 [Planctomycetota bacterium]
MKSLIFAAARLADAATEHGIPSSRKSTAVTDYSDELHHGRNLRSHTIAAMFKLVYQRGKAVLNDIQQTARQQQEVKRVLSLSDHMLSDIGLQQADLASIRSGQLTLETIQQQRKAASKSTTTPGSLVTLMPQTFEQEQAANQDKFDSPKCA